MYGGCATDGAINLPLVEDDCLMWPHDKWDMQRDNGSGSGLPFLFFSTQICFF